MTNAVVLKSQMCIKWTMKTSGYDSDYKRLYVSKDFSCRNIVCHLEFSLGAYRANYPAAGYEKSHLYFKSNNKPHSEMRVTVRVSKGSECLDVQAGTIRSGNESIWSCSKGLPNILLTFEIIIYTDTLTGDKSVQISPETVEKSVQIVSYKDAFFSLESLSRDFSQLLDEGPHHDMEFIIGDHTIKAHKNIICSRSNIFTTMLQSDMLEGKTGQVEIKDMDATIFNQFLKCLYTGMLPELAVESAFQLYEAFDKYGIETLKKQCADFLTDNLTHENSCDILTLSDQHSDDDFKKNVIEYVIKENVPYMGQKWTDFCTENPKLSNEVYRLFCEQFRPK